MILHPPFIITARLLPGLRIGAAFISIEFAGETPDGRARYQYHIDGPAWEHSARDLKSGCGGGSLQEGMESLLSFLGAAAESYAFRQRTGYGADSDGEGNESLFPVNVVEWAYQEYDEITMLGLELDENKELITP